MGVTRVVLLCTLANVTSGQKTKKAGDKPSKEDIDKARNNWADMSSMGETMFKLMDKDGDGILTKKEMDKGTDLIATKKVKSSESDAMFKQMDRNGDGKVTRE